MLVTTLYSDNKKKPSYAKDIPMMSVRIEKPNGGRIGIHLQNTARGVTIVNFDEFPLVSTRCWLQTGDCIRTVNSKTVTTARRAARLIRREKSSVVLEIDRLDDSMILGECDPVAM